MQKIMLEVKKLEAGYADNRRILRNINFTVNKGEMVGLIGKNGAGKSTLLKTLRGIMPMQGGTVKLLNKDINKLTNREFACLAAYLQQQVEVSFGYTAKDIVLAGRYPHLKWWEREKPADEAIVKACMEYTDVWELAGKTMHSISGGQKQRVLLAKILAQQTPVLFLDEPTTGLDIFYQEEIFRFCSELCLAGKTVIMVVHELALAARFCSRLMLIGEGSVLADGSAEAVLTEENLQKAYGVEVKVVKNPLTGHIEVFTPLTKNTALEKQKKLQLILG